jgi:uncharacterized protein (DUF302 family)
MVFFGRLFFAPLATGLMVFSAHADTPQQNSVDQSFEAVAAAVADEGLVDVIQIDHSRLAADVGVEMPPSRVQIFSDPRINATIMNENVRAGLDLPFRTLSFDEKGKPTLLYTASDFLAQRHGLRGADALSDFDARLTQVFETLKDVSPQRVASKDIEKGFAIIELQSAYNVPETVARLRDVVTAQSDTIWFGEIDFQKEAADNGVELLPAQLLLFGGPAPGGVAMAEFPAIGLDAFCQKLLVYEGNDGRAVVLFNDIAALAELHYGRTIEPHTLLNERLTQTFLGAIK